MKKNYEKRIWEFLFYLGFGIVFGNAVWAIYHAISIFSWFAAETVGIALCAHSSRAGKEPKEKEPLT